MQDGGGMVVIHTSEHALLFCISLAVACRGAFDMAPSPAVAQLAEVSVQPVGRACG